MKRTVCAIALAVLCCASAAAEGQKPRALLIGDSISGYYKPYVMEFLKDKVDVVHSGHASDSGFGLAHIDEWLAKHKADVIHFNWGLHDVKPVEGRRNNVPIEEYVSNLREIVRRMKRTRARLIFATTTPVGPHAARWNEDVIKYNAAALKVMKEERIAIDDLYAVAAPIREKIQSGDDIHFKPYGKDPPPENDEENGCKILGKAVAESIRKAFRVGRTR